MNDIFDLEVNRQLKERVNNLNIDSKPLWGKMTVDQMLAHCNIMFDMTFTDNYPKFSAIKVFMLRIFAKKIITGPKPYSKNSRTIPDFVVADRKNFELEKNKLINYITKVQELGSSYFEGKFYRSFGKMTAAEWSVLFSKHLDHHLQQFDV